MGSDVDILRHKIAGAPVYCRNYIKRDGRELFLYGFKPHELPPLAEDKFVTEKGAELRWHPFRGEWNIYAAHRQNRTLMPSAAENPLAPSSRGGAKTEIPFSNFELAVFENKFTSLHNEAPAPPPRPIHTIAAKGRCEVVVYSPEPDKNLHSIGQERRRLLLAAWIDRYAALFARGCKFVMPFENRGDAAGVTLSHPHGQIYGFPFVPRLQQVTSEIFAGGYDLSAQVKEIAPDYEIASAGGLCAFCPPFARFPYEVWITPRIQKPGPWAFTEEELDGFAYLLGEVTRRYDALFGQDTASMLTLHAAPIGEESSFHFTAQFYPLLRGPGRVKYLASVEQATGVFTVDVLPETAAKSLRAL